MFVLQGHIKHQSASYIDQESSSFYIDVVHEIKLNRFGKQINVILAGPQAIQARSYISHFLKVNA